MSDFQAMLERIGRRVVVDEAKAAEYDAIAREQEIKSLRMPSDLEQAMIAEQDAAGRSIDQSTTVGRDLMRALQRRARHIVLSGPAGTGKSYAAAQAICGLLEPDPDTKAPPLRNSRWLSSIQWCVWRTWESDRRPFLHVPMLVVDDLGLEDLSVANRIEELIYTRHAERLQTIYTTNLSGKQFAERYHERVTSRLAEKNAGAWIKAKEEMRR